MNVSEETGQNKTIWDYIIIGAGSAGCVLANKLSASGDKSVLVVEAGGSDNALGFKSPIGHRLWKYIR